jgi:glycosyltransferase involved in cell wall biosynthesis
VSAKSNPTIAFDTWVLGPQARNQGVYVYSEQLLRHFRELGPLYSVQVAPFVSEGMDNRANDFSAAPGFQPRQTTWLRHSRFWRYGAAGALAFLRGADLVFNPHCTTLYAGRPVPTVTTIHDVIPALLPADSRIAKALRFFLWSAAKTSRAIITISQYSKASLMRAFGVAESRIHVVYNGCDQEVFNSSPPEPGLLDGTKKRIGLQRPYLLHYGALKPNKNLQRLVRAYRSLMERNPCLELDLVLAGVHDSGFAEVESTSRQVSGVRGGVVLTGSLDQQDLVRVIKGARLAVFPSLYEGFCLPMIESMACGTPTVAANSSCLPEVSGGVLRYFDPCSEEEMSACLESALMNEEMRRELAEQGRVRALQFDWRRCAEQTLTVLSGVAHEGRKTNP